MNAAIFVVSCVVAGILASRSVAEWMQHKVETDAPGITRVAGALRVCGNQTDSPPDDVHLESVDLDCIMAWARTGASRIMWANAVFFGIMLVSTFGISSRNSCRYGFHAGSWGVKIMLVTFLCVCSFLISPDFFASKWHWVEAVGTMIFNVLQMLVLIRGSHALAKRLALSHADGRATVLLIAYSMMICMIYTFCVVVSVFQYRASMRVQVIVNAALVGIVTLISLLPYVRYATPSSGILQASIVSLQIVVFTYTTTSREMDMLVSTASVILETFGLVYLCTRRRVSAGVAELQDDEDEAGMDDALSLPAPQQSAAAAEQGSKAIGYSCVFFYAYLVAASMRISSIVALAADAAVQTDASWIMVAAAMGAAAAYAWSLFYPAISRHKNRAY
jgi:hypothetical protein